MKKIITLLLFINFSTIVFAQNEVTEYYGGVFYARMFNEEGTLVKNMPFGKNVSIKYDDFYKSYYITIDGQDGIMKFDLRFEYYDQKGDKIYKDKENSIYLYYSIMNQLENHGRLILFTEEFQEFDGNRVIFTFIFKNLKKKID